MLIFVCFTDSFVSLVDVYVIFDVIVAESSIESACCSSSKKDIMLSLPSSVFVLYHVSSTEKYPRTAEIYDCL